MDGSEPALCSPGSSMVARLMCDAGATEGARSDGAEKSSSDWHDAQLASDSFFASELAAAGGGASELAAAGGSTPEAAAAAASPEAAAAFGTSSSGHDATFASDSGGASGRAAPEAAAAEAAVPEAAVPKAAAAEVAVPQSPLQIREVDVAEFAHLFFWNGSLRCAASCLQEAPCSWGRLGGSRGNGEAPKHKLPDGFQGMEVPDARGAEDERFVFGQDGDGGPPPLTASVGASG